MKNLAPVLSLLLLPFAGCDDVENHDHDHDHEVITTVQLSFAPSDGGTVLGFVWADPELDGDPVVDDIVLPEATVYDLSVSFWNEQEEPAEDLTAEISDEGSEHQVFFTGSGVQSPSTGVNGDAVVEQAYADLDAGGLPVGLENTITTLTAGTGEMMVTLRHLPPVEDQDVKVADLADAVATGGVAAIGGGTDVEVMFNIEVQ